MHSYGNFIFTIDSSIHIHAENLLLLNILFVHIETVVLNLRAGILSQECYDSKVTCFIIASVDMCLPKEHFSLNFKQY